MRIANRESRVSTQKALESANCQLCRDVQVSADMTPKDAKYFVTTVNLATTLDSSKFYVYGKWATKSLEWHFFCNGVRTRKGFSIRLYFFLFVYYAITGTFVNRFRWLFLWGKRCTSVVVPLDYNGWVRFIEFTLSVDGL